MLHAVHSVDFFLCLGQALSPVPLSLAHCSHPWPLSRGSSFPWTECTISLHSSTWASEEIGLFRPTSPTYNLVSNWSWNLPYSLITHFYPLLNILDCLSFSFHSTALCDLLACYLAQKTGVYWLTLLHLLTPWWILWCHRPVLQGQYTSSFSKPVSPSVWALDKALPDAEELCSTFSPQSQSFTLYQLLFFCLQTCWSLYKQHQQHIPK